MNGLGRLGLIFCSIVAVSGQSINVTSLPESLFEANGGVHNVVEGSVIQLYCSVEPATATVSWTLDNVTVVIDVPHLRVRTSSNSTHNNSVLTVDNFRSGDNGVYQCHAENGSNTESGTTVTLTDSETTVINGFNIPPLRDNRTSLSLGDTETLTCTAEHMHVNQMTTGFGMPCPAWIKDGASLASGGDITITPQSSCAGTNGQITSTLLISNFQESDVGVYQCIFTDENINDGEIITSIPLRLDTGNTLTLTRVSPQAVILRPPEKLVLEVKATGQYGYIDWTKNGDNFSPTQTDPFFVKLPNNFPTSSELVNFFEIYVREPTTVNDLGVYEIQVAFIDANAAQSQINNDLPSIAVISPVNVSSATTSGSTETLLEGNSIDISCSFTGIPTPTVSWSLNGNSTPFDQTDTVKPFSATIERNMNDDLQVVPVLGEITSVLNIVSATYPDHDGVYTCVGVNADDAVFTSSSASITVEVRVVPEVEVTSDFPNNAINIGGTITLTCNVTRGNPAVYTYRWTHSTSGTTLTESSNVLTISVTSANMLGTYECYVTNDAGSGNGIITIGEGFPPSVTAVQPAGPVVVDTDVELVCVVTGDPPLIITWSHDSGRGVFTGNETTGGSFTLTVNSDDYGAYTCAASNALGSDNDMITIVQAVGPILSRGQTSEVIVGDNLTLSTTISGFNLPVTDITWTRNGEVVTSSTDRITITSMGLDTPNGTSTLTLSPVNFPSDGGMYTVTATNPAGSDMTVFTVTVIGPPSIPGSLLVTIINSQTVVISWEEPISRLPILNYTVHVVPLEVNVSKSNTSIEFPPDVLNVSVNGLQPNSSYQVSVLASSLAGMGEEASVEFHTPPDVLLFQLRLSGIQNCEEWIVSNRTTKTDEIANSIVENVNGRCKCGFTTENITSDEFQCFPESNNSVTYRGKILETDQASVFHLISHIEDWIASGSIVINVEAVSLQIDSTCVVQISSLADRECERIATTTETSGTEITTGTTPTPASEQTNNLIPIIGGAAGGGVVILLVVIVFLIIIIALVVKRHRNKNWQPKSKDSGDLPLKAVQYKKAEKGAESQNTEDVSHTYDTAVTAHNDYDTASPTHDTTNTYDTPITTQNYEDYEGYVDVSPTKKNNQTTTGDYDLTHCVAYAPTPENQ